MPTTINSGQSPKAAGRVLVNGAYRVVAVLGRSRLLATYTVEDEIGDRYVLIEFPGTAGEVPGPQNRIGDGEVPSLGQFMALVERLSRLRHPNIEPITQVFEEDGKGYALLDARADASVSELLAENAFFFQPAEVLQAAEDLLEAMAYIEAVGLAEYRPDTVALGFDSDGRLTINTATSIERMILAGGIQNLPPVKYQTAACLHALLSGTEPLARGERIALTNGKEKDAHIPLAQLGLPYPESLVSRIDDALSLGDREPDMTILEWSKSVQELANAPAESGSIARTGRRGFGRGVAWGSVCIFALAAGWYVSQNKDLFTTPSEGITRVVAQSAQPTGSDNKATKAATAKPDVAVSRTQDAQTQELSVLSDDAALSEIEDRGTSQPIETTQDVGAEPTDVSAPEHESPKRTTAKVEDLTSIFQELAGQNSQPSEPAEPQDADPEQVEVTPTPETPAETTRSVDVRPTDLAALLRKDWQEPQAEAATANSTETATSTPVSAPGWTFDEQISYEIAQNADGKSVLRILSIRERFSFVAKNPWYFGDVEIHSVAGEKVEASFSLADALAKHFQNGDARTPIVDITVAQSGSTEVSPAQLNLPIEYRGTVGDMTLVQRSSKGAWQIVVADAAGHADVLSDGDLILGATAASTHQMATLREFQAFVADQRRLGQTEVALRVKPVRGQIRTVLLRSVGQ